MEVMEICESSTSKQKNQGTVAWKNRRFRRFAALVIYNYGNLANSSHESHLSHTSATCSTCLCTWLVKHKRHVLYLPVHLLRSLLHRLVTHKRHVLYLPVHLICQHFLRVALDQSSGLSLMGFGISRSANTSAPAHLTLTQRLPQASASRLITVLGVWDSYISDPSSHLELTWPYLVQSWHEERRGSPLSRRRRVGWASVLWITNFSSSEWKHPVKLSLLGLNTSLCNWILDFLTGRLQFVRIGSSTSNTTTLSTGALQGSVLSPLLFTLLTHDCAAMHSSNHIIKFADDTTVVGLINKDNESAYREEVRELVSWCKVNNLYLNVDKTKEMVVDFRRARRDHSPLAINGSSVEIVKNIKFLGVHIAENLTWTLNTSSITKRAQQRLYFLRKLREAHLPSPILTTFYRGTVESILSSCIITWFGNCTAFDRKTLQRIVRTAEKIIGVSLPSITDIYITRCIQKATNIVKDPTHPSHELFTLLPSGRRLLNSSPKPGNCGDNTVFHVIHATRCRVDSENSQLFLTRLTSQTKPASYHFRTSPRFLILCLSSLTFIYSATACRPPLPDVRGFL
ncbi:hypothetical protein P4O66_001241 [Electrophorus voltai]|uniref:Reverse transcriptase domain-containing protein n=1 Tax=Electrophorus voltai TaxID=2609070 RepID=A0AAD8ZAL4_9TELE|nr:hypothetical protein P4O66_001241 [Electrophorus voltai]